MPVVDSPNGTPSSGDGKGVTATEIDGQKIDAVTEGVIISQRAFAGGVELFVDLGRRSRGFYATEFPVPVGVTLIVGQVQEGINAGDAVYQTLGIAVRNEGNVSWRGRVVWRMDWSESAAITTYGRFVMYTG